MVAIPSTQSGPTLSRHLQYLTILLLRALATPQLGPRVLRFQCRVSRLEPRLQLLLSARRWLFLFPISDPWVLLCRDLATLAFRFLTLCFEFCVLSSESRLLLLPLLLSAGHGYPDSFFNQQVLLHRTPPKRDVATRCVKKKWRCVHASSQTCAGVSPRGSHASTCQHVPAH